MTESTKEPIENLNENNRDKTEESPDVEKEKTVPADTPENNNEGELLSGIQFELAAFRKKAKENEEGWQRARAEFLNYKKRTEREMRQVRHRAALDTISAFLPIIDDFERAMENIPADLGDNAWVSGISLLQRKFEKVMDDHDVEVIDPTGQEFDPNYHEGIGMDTSDEVESGHVTVTLQKGYISGDHLLRPALVRIAN